MKVKKTINIFLTCLLIIAVSLTLTSCSIRGNSRVTVDLNNYISFSGSGYNGYGTINYIFDTASFINDYDDKITLQKENTTEELSVSAAQSLVDTVAHTGCFSKSEGLSNGDTITFSWDLNVDSIEDMYDIQLDCSAFSVSVTGLTELKEVNILDGDTIDNTVFDGISVSVTGISPQATACVNTTGSVKDVLPSMFILSKASYLSNGDTVTLSITEDGKRALAETCGIVPTVTEKNFIINGLPYFASSISDIPENSFESAYTQIQQERAYDIELEVENDKNAWGQQLRIFTSMNYDSCYLFSNVKTGNNYLIFAYDVHVLHNNKNNDLVTPVNYYYFGYYPDVVINANGQWSVPYEYNSAADMLGDGGTFSSSLHFSVLGTEYTENRTYEGFLSKDKMLSKIQEALSDDYVLVDAISST